MSRSNTKPNILLLSAGSKVALSRIAKTAALQAGATLYISDHSINVPSRLVADQFIQIPFSNSDEWVKSIVNHCEKNQIGLVIPTRHSELELLSTHQTLFAQREIQLVLSSNEVLKNCIDKLNTHSLFQKLSVPTPQTIPFEEWEQKKSFPIIIKPINGSGSDSVYELTSSDQIPADGKSLIAQRKAQGIEYTINLYVDKSGACLTAIPHRRIFVEQGEVMQAQTERIDLIIDYATKIVESVAGFRGPINIQAFYDETANTCEFIEINPRIGGGFPLANQAGGQFIHWLCQEYLLNQTPTVKHDWTEKLTMMRYRDAFFS